MPSGVPLRKLRFDFILLAFRNQIMVHIGVNQVIRMDRCAFCFCLPLKRMEYKSSVCCFDVTQKCDSTTRF